MIAFGEKRINVVKNVFPKNHKLSMYIYFYINLYYTQKNLIVLYMKSRQKIRQNRSRRARLLKGGALSEIVYVVLENGELYPNLYSTYEFAREAVTTKYAEELQSQREEAEEMGIHMSSNVDIDEDESGTTQLYIEKEINITIQRYNVPHIAI
jgi:hypothetical protein